MCPTKFVQQLVRLVLWVMQNSFPNLVFQQQ
jgi:hypothetical protein